MTEYLFNFWDRETGVYLGCTTHKHRPQSRTILKKVREWAKKNKIIKQPFKVVIYQVVNFLGKESLCQWKETNYELVY